MRHTDRQNGGITHNVIQKQHVTQRQVTEWIGSVTEGVRKGLMPEGSSNSANRSSLQDSRALPQASIPKNQPQSLNPPISALMMHFFLEINSCYYTYCTSKRNYLNVKCYTIQVM